MLSGAIPGVRVGITVPPVVYVDPDSIGGPASDTYTFAQATNPATPWATLGKAINDAPNGYVVRCRPATYPATDVARKRRTGPVTLMPYGDDPNVNIGNLAIPGTTQIIIDGLRFTTITMERQIGGVWYAAEDITLRNCIGKSVALGSSKRVTMEDFEMIGDGGVGNPLTAIGSTSSLTRQLDDFVMRRGVIHGYTECLRFSRFNRMTWDDIEVYDVVDPGGDAHPDVVQWFWDTSQGSANDFIGNKIWIHDYIAQGFFVNMPVNNARLSNSLIEGPLEGPWVASDFFEGNNVEWVNVTVRGSTRFTVHAPDAGESPKVVNGRMVNSIINSIAIATTKTIGGTTYQATASQLVLDKGNVWPTSGKHSELGAIDASSVTGTPTFVDPATADYRLAAGSVGKGIGTTPAGVDVPAVDRLNRTRTLPLDPGSDQS